MSGQPSTSDIDAAYTKHDEKLPPTAPPSTFGYALQGSDWTAPGVHQSPIDIHDVPREREEMHVVTSTNDRFRPLELQYPRCSSYRFEPDANTVKLVNLSGGFQGVTLDSKEPETFKVANVHFHAPSEHTVKGKNFSLEMHMVHSTEAGKKAVLGVFYEVSNKRSALLDSIINHEPVDIQAELGGLVDWFHFYQGSLTTPPCTEGINWFLLHFGEAFALPATAGQIAFFTSKWAENPSFAGGHGNNRLPQQIGDRAIYQMIPNQRG